MAAPGRRRLGLNAPFQRHCRNAKFPVAERTVGPSVANVLAGEVANQDRLFA